MQDRPDRETGIKQTVPAGNAPAGDRKPHTLWVVDRKEISAKGVTDVLSFDERSVELVTTDGRLTLEGRGLHVTVLDTAGGVVTVQGLLCGAFYEPPEEDDVPGRKRRSPGLFR